MKKLKIALSLLLLGALTISCYGQNEQKKENVIITKPKLGTIKKTLSFTGETRPVIESFAAADVSGPVAKIFAEDGQRVEAGEILAEIDKARFSLTLRLAQAALEVAKQKEIEVNSNYLRNKKLFDKGAITQKSFDKALTEKINAESSKKQAQVKMEIAKLDLARCSIKAPVKGFFVNRTIDLGQAMARGQNMGRVIDLDTIYVEARIPEVDIRKIKIGQSCTIEDKFKGKISHINLYADNSRSFLVKITVPNKELFFKANMYVEGKITIETFENVPLFDSQAIRTHKGNYSIFLIENGIAKRKQINITAQKGDRTYSKDISISDTIVLTGQDNLDNGTPVIIRNISKEK